MRYVKSIALGTPEWTNPYGGGPGAADGASPDRQAFVVLCATSKPDSKALPKEWCRSLQESYRQGMDVDATIAEVLRRAGEHRRRNGQSPPGKKGKNRIERSMHEVPRQLFRT